MSERLVIELEKLWDVGNEHLPAAAEVMTDAHDELQKTAARSSLALFADPMFKKTMVRWNIVRDNFVTVLAASAERTLIAGDAVKSLVQDYADTDTALAEEMRARFGDFRSGEDTGRHISTGG